jgi:hypothetical protein
MSSCAGWKKERGGARERGDSFYGLGRRREEEENGPFSI